MFRTSITCLFALASLNGCIDDSEELELGSAEAAVSGGIVSGPPAGIVRVRRANDAAAHTGILIGNVGGSTLMLTSDQWASWQSPTALTLGIPGSGGTFTARTSRFVNTSAFFPGAIVQIDGVAGNQFPIDTRSPAQLVGQNVNCFEYISDMQVASVVVRITSANGGDLAFSHLLGGTLAAGDAGAACLTDTSSAFVGFLTTADANGDGHIQHANSMTPWLDGIRNLAAVRDDSRNVMLAIHTKPNATARMCLDVPWGSPFSQTAVNQFPCHNGPSQRWWFDYSVDANFPRIVSDSSGLCLDVAGNVTTAGADFQIYPCHAGLNQRFESSLWPDSGIRMRPRNSGSLANCISVEGGASTASRRAEQRACVNSSDQKWFWQFNPPFTP